MRLREITNTLEKLAPLYLQEAYDNSGLIYGNPEAEITSALLSLDCTEAVVAEAQALGCNLIISHHPLVFSGLKKLTGGGDYVQRTLIKAIQGDIAIYAIHTNLDNIWQGVNHKIASRLGLHETRILEPKEGLLKKMVVYVPHAQSDEVRQTMFDAGGGLIGDYAECSFNAIGEGTFIPLPGARPFSGVVGTRQEEAETRIEMIVSADRLPSVLSAMLKVHPYEEVAYDLFTLDNAYKRVGAGLIGKLEQPMPFVDFLGFLKEQMQTTCIRYTAPCKKLVSSIALCGGSGSFLIPAAIRAGADVFVTADMKYHQFFDADQQLVIADIGHFESEQFTPEILKSYLGEKFPTFATHFSAVLTNPVNYYV